MAVNKKVLLTEKEAVDLILRYRNYKHDLDLASVLAGAKEQLAKLDEEGVYFRNSDKLCISDWRARGGG